MPDLPPDLPRLRTLESYLQLLLAEVQQAITRREHEAEAAERGRQARPPSPDWMLSFGIGGRTKPPTAVHEGHCTMAGDRTRGITREDALRWLAEGIPACTFCRPDTELGYLDG
ncbi:DUF6233 domain-containing protein [Streptomyces sp. NPDC091281]|uniref:DUF6233 domain-containing protein n=1 Tax=Streptomyces sp. NPDC091281 TaxID=3365985 RepID=UPI00382F206E